MLAELKVESTLTDKYQTTMPGVVRKALGLKKRDRISYTILPDGDVLLSRSPDAVEDPVKFHADGGVLVDLVGCGDHRLKRFAHGGIADRLRTGQRAGVTTKVRKFSRDRSLE